MLNCESWKLFEVQYSLNEENLACQVNCAPETFGFPIAAFLTQFHILMAVVDDWTKTLCHLLVVSA